MTDAELSGATAGRDALREAVAAMDRAHDELLDDLSEDASRARRVLLDGLRAADAALAALDGLPDTPGEDPALVIGALDNFIQDCIGRETVPPEYVTGAQRIRAALADGSLLLAAAPAPAARPAPDKGLRADVERLCDEADNEDSAVYGLVTTTSLRAALAAPDRAEHAHRFSFGLCMEQGCAEQEPPAPSPEDGAHRDTLRGGEDQ